jgi:hypothetical protein
MMVKSASHERLPLSRAGDLREPAAVMVGYAAYPSNAGFASRSALGVRHRTTARTEGKLDSY